MRRGTWHWIAGVLGAVLCCVACAGSESKEWKPLFDGKTLAGWEGEAGVFRIEDGALVGGSMEHPLPVNHFLCTKQTYGDFELRLKVKLKGDDPNGGVQFRSTRIPNDTEVSGYQADLGQQYWGCLYDESRRKRVLVQADAKVIAQHVDKQGWNEYRIRCEGPHIQLWMNGKKTVDYVEKEKGIAQRGIIGLQIHAGKPAEAWYKNIEIRELLAGNK